MASVANRTDSAVLRELGKPLELVSLQVGTPAPGQVLVEIAYSGVCRSQLLEARGHRGPDRFLPHTLGHEGAGVVLETGAGVTKVKPGDHVVLSWIKGVGVDVLSTVYQSAVGRVNSGAISTFMRHALVAENRVVPIPAAMPLREAALLGCAIPTGMGIVFNRAKLQAGATVAIFGAGGIGLSALLGARAAGAARIIVVDILAAKLDFARQLGATDTVNSHETEPVTAIRQLTGGRGVDCTIEAAGQRQSMEAAFRAVRDGGGLCVLAGNLKAGEQIQIDPFDLIRGKRVVGTWGGECNPDRDIPRFAQMYLRGVLPLSALVSHEYGLHEINQALDDLDAGKVARALVAMTEGIS